MEQSVEKLLYSRRDTAEALCLSIRSVDYLITTGRLSTPNWGQDSHPYECRPAVCQRGSPGISPRRWRSHTFRHIPHPLCAAERDQ